MLFELKKCLQRKHIICAAIFLIFWGIILPGILTYLYWNINIRLGYSDKAFVAESIEKINSYDLSDKKKRTELSQEENELFRTSDMPQYLLQYMYESVENKISETEIMQVYYNYGTGPSYIRKLIENGKMRSVNSVRKAFKSTESSIYGKQLKMLETVGKPTSEYTRFMQYYENFSNLSIAIVVTFLIFFFSNIGSWEYSTKMNLIIYSSSLGAGRVLINKILSIMAVGFVGVLFLNISQFIIFFGAGYGGNLNISLNCLSVDFVYCPYDISVFEYFIYKILMQLAAVLLISVILVLCSMKFKSSLAAIAVAGAITLGGCAFGIIGFHHSVIVRYSLAGLMLPYFVFKDYYAVGIGDFVILYPVIYIIWLLMIFLFCVWQLVGLTSNKKRKFSFPIVISIPFASLRHKT